jgi:hypothetical protein
VTSRWVTVVEARGPEASRRDGRDGLNATGGR